ncbi:MAG: N-acetyltransferase [Porphyrobacter sp.]|nr:N-acetyltransferase [Porphyrobacter sp.]
MSDTISITHHVQGQGGSYVATVAGAPQEGYLKWEPGGSKGAKEVRIAAHTVVPKEIGGRGVAAQLVDRLVEDARRIGFLVRPDCSYVAAKFEENPDWAELRA